VSHTPGPWHVVSKLVGPLCITTENGETLAHVGHDDFKICSANAELIAAAPDLLAALREIQERSFHESTPTAVACGLIADLAIKKAKQ
jgi:hypothetical protein